MILKLLDIGALGLGNALDHQHQHVRCRLLWGPRQHNNKQIKPINEQGNLDHGGHAARGFILQVRLRCTALWDLCGSNETRGVCPSLCVLVSICFHQRVCRWSLSVCLFWPVCKSDRLKMLVQQNVTEWPSAVVYAQTRDFQGPLWSVCHTCRGKKRTVNIRCWCGGWCFVTNVTNTSFPISSVVVCIELSTIIIEYYNLF